MKQGERGPPGMNGTQGFQGCPGHRGTKVGAEGAGMEETQSPGGGSLPSATPAALVCHATTTKSIPVVVSTWPSTKQVSAGVMALVLL